jgi:heptosyltransferase-2
MSDLLVRVPNWVGDVCKSLPTLDALEQVGFRLHLAARRPLEALLAGFNRPVIQVGKGVIGPARALRGAGCDSGVLLTTSFGTAAAARLAGIRMVGFREDRRNWLLHRVVDYPMGMHEVDAHVFLGRIAQETFAPSARWPENELATPRLRLTYTHRDEAETALRAAGIREPFIVLCPLATGTRDGQSKVWPHWSEMGRHLATLGRRLVVCPGPGEEEASVATVPEATLLSGVSLGGYAAVCARAEQVLANDSGPLHLAAAAGAPVIGIYGVAVGPTHRPRGADFIGSEQGWPSFDEVAARLTV